MFENIPNTLKILALILLLLIFSGCREQNIDKNPGDTPSDQIERVVSLSPNITQIIFALGAQDKLVGVDEYSIYPEAAKDIPGMGSYLDPDIESLIAADPDIVFILDTDEAINQDLADLGIRFESFGNDTVNEISESIIKIGALLDRPDGVEQIALNMVNATNDIATRLNDVDPVTVALVVGRNPGRLQDIYVAGGGNFLGELLDTAGGINVFADEPVPWPQVGVESLIGLDPDVIIDSTLAKGASEAEYASLLKDWEGLPSLKAVKNGNVVIAKEGWFQIPGAYLDSTLYLFAHWLHPDIFPDKPDDPNL